MSKIPLKQLDKLVWELKIGDMIFCENIINNADDLWVHFSVNSAKILETDEPDSQTLFVISMKNIKIKNLDREDGILFLSEPINYEGLSFDKIDLNHWDEFKFHMESQSKLIYKYFAWNEYNVIDTGIKNVNFWNMSAN